MIKLAREVYAAVAILSPIAFAILRITGYYNFAGKNSYIFIGLFVLSLITLFLTTEGEK